MGKLAALVGANIRRIRKARKRSIRAVAADFSGDPNYLGDVELGRENPTLSQLEDIADALDVDVTLFFQPIPPAPGPVPDMRVALASIKEWVQVAEAAAPYAATPKSPRRRGRTRRR